jgi:hypothetical protein
MSDGRAIVKAGGEITLEEWRRAIEILDGIRISPRRETEAEVFDSHYAEWVEAFSLVDGRVQIRDASMPNIARAAAALAAQLDAVVSA